MDIFSSREIATTIWAVALLFYALKSEAFVKSFVNLLSHFKSLKIIFPLEGLAIYLFLLGWCSSQFFAWGVGELKSAIMWFFFVGTVLFYKAVTQDEDYKPIRAWIKNTFTLIILLEFISAKYTFHIGVELLLVPVLSIIAMTSVFAESQEETKSVANFCQWILVLIGLYMIYHGARQLLSDAQIWQNWNILKEFSLPLLLSLLTIPYFFALHVIVTYENSFSKLRYAVPDEALRKQTKWRAISRFGLHLKALKRWAHRMQGERPETIEVVDKIIDEAHEQQRLSENPPPVVVSQGWSPYIAKNFLEGIGVKTFDYREYDGRWHADSHVIKFERGFTRNNLNYFLEGNRIVADTMRLKLTIFDFDQQAAHVETLKVYAAELLRQGLPDDNADNIVEHVFGEGNPTFETPYHSVTLNIERTDAGNIQFEEYEFRIAIKSSV